MGVIGEQIASLTRYDNTGKLTKAIIPGQTCYFTSTSPHISHTLLI